MEEFFDSPSTVRSHHGIWVEYWILFFLIRKILFLLKLVGGIFFKNFHTGNEIMSWDWQLFLNFFLSTSFFQNIFNLISSFFLISCRVSRFFFYIHSFFKFHLARSLSTSLLLGFPLAPLTFHWCCCRKPHDVHVGLPWLSPCWSAAASPRFLFPGLPQIINFLNLS